MVYDDVYRLLGETVVQAGEITKETLYTYDNASNRASKVEKENGDVVKDITYTYNAANQLTAWSEANGAAEPLRSAAMTYDTRGNRASTAITTHGTEPTTATTTYAWTAQNMLASVTLPDASVHSYGYDYRVRRVTRSEPGGNPVAMTFSGGLSVAEFEVLDSQQNTLNSQPSVEYQRGPDMGGGVGGLLYSLRSGTPKFNLSNGRGDVVAQSDSAGALTWTASYEAYGKRPVETGSNADRQRANTKEEDPTGLLNEGFRMRELETGVWMSRDPAGFVDGPNLYAYVLQNPWSKFDPLGLSEESVGLDEALKDGKVSMKEMTRLSLTNEQSQAIISATGNEPESTPDKVKKNARFEPDKFSNSYNWFTEAGRLRKTYPGMSDDEIAVAESARLNAVQAKWLLFRHLGSSTDKDRYRMLGALFEVASISTMPLMIPSAAGTPWVGSRLAANVGGKTTSAAGIVSEAKFLMKSPQMNRLRQAFEAGEELTVRVNGRSIQLVPNGPFSGFTNFRGNGFAIGREAFRSEAELQKTVLHELHRLNTSLIRSSGAPQTMVTRETAAAAAFAEKYAPQLSR